MNAADFRFGFRIVGKTCEPRRLVDAGAAFAAYAACDPKAEPDKESYLSAFQFADDFADHLRATGSTAGFSGPCWAHWLWFDIDSPDDVLHAQHDCQALASYLLERYEGVLSENHLMAFFSGSKGFHLGLPTSLWAPAPGPDFHRVCRRFAERIAAAAQVTIDVGVYDRVRAFRAPNSRHPKTGLHKRPLSCDELLRLSIREIQEAARSPAPFDLPAPPGFSEVAAADWQAAVDQVKEEGEAKAVRRAAGNGAKLNRATVEFIRQGAHQGDRHRLLFSAAANLGEFGCPPALAHALLTEPALDSGLCPSDVRRGIECGLAAAPSPSPVQSTLAEAQQSQATGADDPTDQEPPERDQGDSRGLAGQSCQQATGATIPKPAADLRAALARLWASPSASAPRTDQMTPGQTPAPSSDDTPADVRADLARLWASPALGAAPVTGLPAATSAPCPSAGLPPTPVPLPAGAVGSGCRAVPCRCCGSHRFAEWPIPEGRTRLDCLDCKAFLDFGKWYDK